MWETVKSHSLYNVIPLKIGQVAIDMSTIINFIQVCL